jgi:hypothetical protein
MRRLKENKHDLKSGKELVIVFWGIFGLVHPQYVTLLNFEDFHIRGREPQPTSLDLLAFDPGNQYCPTYDLHHQQEHQVDFLWFLERNADEFYYIHFALLTGRSQMDDSCLKPGSS